MTELPASTSTDAPPTPDNPALSVVMSVYNGKRFLPSAVRSVLGQTFADFEFIIIDDGSADGSGELLEKLATTDPRIRLVRRENKGLIYSLNEGFRLARAPLVARMDGDDLCRPERFATQLAYLNSHPDCVVLSCRVLCIDSAGWPIGEEYTNVEHDQIEDCMWGRGGGGTMSHPGAILRKDAFEKVGGYHADYLDAEDFDLWLRMAEVGRLHNLPDILLDYRHHPGSVSMQRAVRQRESVLRSLHDAAERRGCDPPNPDNFGFVKNMSKGDVRYRIAEHAQRSGYPWTARKHTLLRYLNAPMQRTFWERFMPMKSAAAEGSS